MTGPGGSETGRDRRREARRANLQQQQRMRQRERTRAIQRQRMRLAMIISFVVLLIIAIALIAFFSLGPGHLGEVLPAHDAFALTLNHAVYAQGGAAPVIWNPLP